MIGIICDGAGADAPADSFSIPFQSPYHPDGGVGGGLIDP